MCPFIVREAVLWINVLGFGSDFANNDRGGLDYRIERGPRLFTNTAAQYRRCVTPKAV